ncbi:MAG: 50S ribosomal protein L11 methyltransferase [Gammaproteobacteria bacterium]|nr:50S ribosomal protein L11 methyltransferase [Gammaproteobacteria bacterium]
MAWWQFSIQCELAEVESIEELFFDLGAISINLADARDEPIYEPLPGHMPLWKTSIVTGMFDSSNDPEQLFQQICERLPQHLQTNLRHTRLNDQDWIQAYRDHYYPIQCADNLWIVPGWHKPPDPEATNIILDPGIAFGTGGHPTTALCLSWLAENNLGELTVVDYGCGSGILAIAALKLGAKRVIGIDIDPQALEASRQNANRNNIPDDQFPLFLPDQYKITDADLLIANILTAPLVKLTEKLATLVKPGGKILLSGILDQQTDAIQSAYQVFFKLDPTIASDGWVRVTGTRLYA